MVSCFAFRIELDPNPVDGFIEKDTKVYFKTDELTDEDKISCILIDGSGEKFVYRPLPYGETPTLASAGYRESYELECVGVDKEGNLLTNKDTITLRHKTVYKGGL